MDSGWLARDPLPVAPISSEPARLPAELGRAALELAAVGAESRANRFGFHASTLNYNGNLVRWREFGAVDAGLGAKRPEFHAGPPEFQWNFGGLA